jgi:hypothetical protein
MFKGDVAMKDKVVFLFMVAIIILMLVPFLNSLFISEYDFTPDNLVRINQVLR